MSIFPFLGQDPRNEETDGFLLRDTSTSKSCLNPTDLPLILGSSSWKNTSLPLSVGDNFPLSYTKFASPMIIVKLFVQASCFAFSI